MCGACGTESSRADWFNAGVQNSPAGRIHARLQVVAAANGFLSHCGMHMQSNPGAATWTLRSPRGAATTVSSFMDIWPSVEKLTGKTFDPLDPAVIAARTTDLESND